MTDRYETILDVIENYLGTFKVKYKNVFNLKINPVKFE